MKFSKSHRVTLALALSLANFFCFALAPTASWAQSGSGISMNFENIEVRSALKMIADFSKMNVMIADSVNGNMSLKLENVTWPDALQSILEINGLEQKRSGNIIRISTKSAFNSSVNTSSEASAPNLQKPAQPESTEALKTQSFALNYAQAADLEKQFNGQINSVTGQTNSRILSPRGEQHG